jgi:hypothetical protein
MAGLEFKADPIFVDVNGVSYQVLLGLDELAGIEKACNGGLSEIFSKMQGGHLSVLIQVIAGVVKKKTEVGYQPLELNEVGPLAQSAELGAALGQAVAALGNALGLMAPSPVASGSGSPQGSRSKPSGKSQTGQ